MTENLLNWVKENKLMVSESDNNGSDIIIVEGVGKYLYLKPFDGKIIDDDFSFILSDDEYNLLDNKEADFILFEFGGRFYCSGLIKGKNKYNELIFKPEFNDFKYKGATSEPLVMEFAHLGVHSEYEILNGSGICQLWSDKAKFLGHKYLGICDKNTLAGALAFQTACDKNKIKCILGETITVAKGYDESVEIQETFELKFFVLNYEGWKNLLLINKAVNVDFSGFIPEELLYEYGAGLCLVIPKESEFNYFKDDRTHCIKLINKYKKYFDEVYYQIDTVEYSSTTLFKKHLSNIDKYICQYRKYLNPILINDSYYLDKENGSLKSLLNKIDGRADAESESQFYKSFQDTVESYSEWLEDVEALVEVVLLGIENSVELSEQANMKINTSERKLPLFEVDDVKSSFFEQLQVGIETRLSHLSKADMDLYLERLETECNVIVPNGLCDYFMIHWDICRWCRENDIMVGSGRGSVCGSLVAYLLRITDVDPIKYDLLFDRFLNETRVSGERAKSADSMPDIDVDFPTEFRDSVKNYIKEKYGHSYTCVIGTYTRMKLKTCIKDFGKIKGLSFDDTNALTKDIDDWQQESWGDLIEYATKSKRLFKFIQTYPELVHTIKFAVFQCRAASVHPSAVVIVPKQNLEGKDIDLFEWLPVKKIDGLLVSEWEGKYMDKSGFLKEDILGLTQLDKFQKIIKLIKANYGVDIDTNEIPFDDENVFKMFKRGWNEDVFQFGTTGLMSYCRSVKPDNLEHLIAMTAVFRPGPMESNAHQDYSDIKNGKKKPHYDFGLQEVTESTSGLYIYQEQIMKAVHVLGGLSLVEADVLRTVMKKKDKKAMAAMSEKFISGAVSRGCSEKEANEIWDKLDKFSGYGFNRSHAAAYSIMSYWSQWFKVNYSLEFWTTSLQHASEVDIPFRLAEIKKIGEEIEVRPPDVNFSDQNFTCDHKNRRIFFSLTKIKGVGDVAVSNIMETRAKGGKFFDLEEFVSRVPSKVNKGVITNLILAGAFDLIEDFKAPLQRKILLVWYFNLKRVPLPDIYNSPEADKNTFWVFEQKRLTGFGDVDYETMIKDSIPSKRIAGLYVAGDEFNKAKEGSEVAVAGKVIAVNERKTKNGNMLSINLESNNAMIGVTVWPDTWADMTEEVTDLNGKVIVVNGRVKMDTYRGQKGLFSWDKTKIYIIS